MTPALSVVIPTRQRPQQLDATLRALAQEALEFEDCATEDLGTEDLGTEDLSTEHARSVEVLIVDDGSEPTAQSGVETPSGLNCRWLRQPSRGPAAARNLGIAAARGTRILLLGDDTRPAPGTLRRHLVNADGQPLGDIGVQGFIAWDPQRPITPLMEFLAPSGPQFYFDGMRDGHEISYTAVLGSNFSAPKTWFVDQTFDEAFPTAALEDTELAYRFRRHGWRSVYDAQALCWHDHHYDDLESFLQRQQRAGRAVRYAVRKHPSLLWALLLQPSLFGLITLARSAVARLSGAEPSKRQRLTWDLQCRLAMLRGFLRP